MPLPNHQLYPPTYEAPDQTGSDLPEIDSVFIPQELTPNQPKMIAEGISIYEPSDVAAVIGFKASIPAVIEAGDKRLMLVDLRSYGYGSNGYRSVHRSQGRSIDFNADFLLVSPEEWHESDGRRGFKAIRANEPVVFGRRDEKLNQRFDISDLVSRSHFRVDYSPGNGIAVTDLGSSNGTAVVSSPYNMQAERSSLAVARLRGDSRYHGPDERAPYGYLDGNPILGRESHRVAGGVYIGGTNREAITVLPDKDPRIEDAYQNFAHEKTIKKVFRRIVTGPEQAPEVQDQLRSVLDEVKKLMRYDGDAVEAFSAKYAGDRAVSLGEYIEQGVGICRHQELLAAYFMERMVADGKLAGRVQLQRNTIPEYGGSHGWSSFRGYDGTEYVVDPAQDFVGTKAEARKQPGAWDYYLPLR